MATSMSWMRVISVSLSSKLSRSVFAGPTKRCKCLMSSTANKKDSETETNSSEANSEKQENAELNKDIENSQTQIKQLEVDVKESKDKYMRALAESENVRRRMTKQVDEAKLYGIQGFCKDLLEVSDILSIAINAVPKEQLKDSNPHLVNLFEGLNMTEGQLDKVFKKHGLESISPKEGEKFDPNIHEALFQVPIQVKETQEGDTVAIVQKIGFRLHTRTLRPALVGVFKS